MTNMTCLLAGRPLAIQVGDRRRWDGMYCTFDINRHNFDDVEGQKFGVCMLLHLVVNPWKTRMVHLSRGFEFLGFKIKRGGRRLRLPPGKIRRDGHRGSLYAYPT